MSQMTIFTDKTQRRKLLLSRLLTRAGDQAWDFAVPLTLVQTLPSGIQAAALYFLAVRFGQVLLAPRVGSLIDRWDRLKVMRVGIGAQVMFMLFSLGLFLGLRPWLGGSPTAIDVNIWLTLLALCGLASNLGALMTEIAVANDIVPTIVPPANLSSINSRLRQIDLLTEVGAPILTGLMLMVQPPTFPLLGFALVAGWNCLSFWPEYRLIRAVVRSRSDLQTKVLVAEIEQQVLSVGQKIRQGWRAYCRQPILPSMIAYALLWLSVLSPHGVLLAAFLKQGWLLSEPVIGAFRGAGALLGLLATYLYPPCERRWGMLRASRVFIVFQALMVGFAAVSFSLGRTNHLFFLGFILLSRIGLYGFSLGEAQIRQLGIPEHERGRVNAFGSALTSCVSLGLFGAGALINAPQQFYILVYGSVVAVVAAACLFSKWAARGVTT